MFRQTKEEKRIKFMKNLNHIQYSCFMLIQSNMNILIYKCCVFSSLIAILCFRFLFFFFFSRYYFGYFVFLAIVVAVTVNGRRYEYMLFGLNSHVFFFWFFVGTNIRQATRYGTLDVCVVHCSCAAQLTEGHFQPSISFQSTHPFDQ